MSKKLRETLQLCREFNVKRLKTTEFEVELGEVQRPAAPSFELKPLTDDDLQDQLKSLSDEMPSDDEMLRASSPFEPLTEGEDEE